MATTNISVTRHWTKVVDAGLDFTLTIGTPFFGIAEVAVSDTNVDPVVSGHQLKSPEESFNRALAGPGYIFVRSASSNPCVAVITAWTP